jgi:HSP20 family protein
MAEKPIDIEKKTTPTPSQSGALWRSFRDEFDQLFDRFTKSVAPWPFSFPSFGGASAPVPSPSSWFSARLPSVDVAEDEKAYTITAELPGLAAEDVDVSVKGGNLVIKGEKRQETKREDKNYYLSECSYGALERSFYLPDGVDRDHIKAEVSKGVLTVTLPKTEAAQVKARKIDVKAA